MRFPVANSGRRLQWLVGALVVAIVLCVGRAFQLQALQAQAYANKATEQMTRTQPLLPERGAILDRNGQVLATTQPAVDVIADPSMIHTNGIDTRMTLTSRQQAAADAAPAAIAAILAKHLGGKPADYDKQLKTTLPNSSKYAGWVVIKKQVPSWTYAELNADLAQGGSIQFNNKTVKVPAWYGIYKQDDPVRVYPQGGVGANVVGFMANGTGGGGLEYLLNDSLTGVAGRESYETSAFGRIPTGNSTLTPAVNGTSYTLTIDSEMQLFAQNAIASQVRATKSRSGTAIVMNVKTGEVLAMATAPSFDPNNIAKSKAADLGNRAVTSAYEPGSVEKVLTMAALVDQGLITPDTHVVVPSRIRVGDGYVTDAFAHNTLDLTARGVIAESSNIGMVELSRQMSKQSLHDYLAAFGYGARTNVGLPGEATGVLPGADMADYTRDQIAFGQGLSVSAIQIAAAVAAIANGGVYNQPSIIKSAVDGAGQPVAVTKADPHRVISQKSSEQVLDMMESVITMIGNGQRQIPNYRMAGKSGTAQAVGANGRYDGFVASFVGVAPVEDPQIEVYVVLDHPQGAHQGSEVALPVVQQLMKLALPRYGVAPSTTPARKEPIFYK